MESESSSSCNLNLQFKVNNELVTLTIDAREEEHLFKITNSDGYTVKYINDLINNGFISLKDPLYRICRLEEEREILIYSAYSAENNQDIENDMNEESIPVSSVTKQCCEWTEDETRMLLDKYEQFMSKVGPMKTFKTKKIMWNKIADILNAHFAIERTGIQVENRYKTVIKRKKDAVDNNKRSGRSRIEVPYEAELSRISSLDDSIEPEIVGTSHGVRILKPSIGNNNQQLTTTTSSTGLTTSSTGSATSSSGSATAISTATDKLRKSKTVHDTLMEIFLKKEEAKERRHLEKLELIRELFGGKND